MRQVSLREFRTRAAYLLGAVFVCAQPQPGRAQVSAPTCEIQPVYGCETAMAQSMRRVAQSYQQAVQEKARFGSQLSASRQKIAQACRSNAFRQHPEKIAEMPHFMTLLADKDLYFVGLQADPFGLGPASTRINDLVERATGGGQQLDGGPRRMSSWDDLISSLHQREQSAPTAGDVMQNISSMLDIGKSPQYPRYVVSRNMAELGALGCMITNDADLYFADSVLVAAPWRNSAYGDVNPNEVLRPYMEALTRAYGEDAIHAAFAKISSYATDNDGRLLLPDGAYLPYNAMIAAIAQTSDRAFLTSHLLGGYSAHHTLPELRRKSYAYDELVAAYGQEAVDRVTFRMKLMTFNADGYPTNKENLDVLRRRADALPLDLLANADKEGYARAMLAFHGQLDSRQAVDAAYDALIKQYGREAVMTAVDKVNGIWDNRQVVDRWGNKDQKQTYLQHYFQMSDPGTDYALFDDGLNGRLPASGVRAAQSGPLTAGQEFSFATDEQVSAAMVQETPAVVKGHLLTSITTTSGSVIPAGALVKVKTTHTGPFLYFRAIGVMNNGQNFPIDAAPCRIPFTPAAPAGQTCRGTVRN